MDTITHGITGALIGKAFYADWHASGAATLGCQDSADKSSARSQEWLRHQADAGRVAVFAATLGAVFPDIDIFVELFSSDDLATLELHRGFTHSFVCLPVFALVLAVLTRWICRRRGMACPAWTRLALIYATGLAIHILLDLITSFGTMIWSPISRTRAAWDITFIIDLIFTGIVLLPQVAAWVYREREQQRERALVVWVLFSVFAAAMQRVVRAVEAPFPTAALVAVIALLAALFFLPAWRGWGFGVRRTAWCRAGFAVWVIYMGLSATAHYAAFRQVRDFAASRGLTVEAVGALPMPPLPLFWTGLIRTPDGVYQSWFRLLEGKPPAFHFFADSVPNGYTEAVKQLPEVKTYLWFARFPVIRYFQQGDRNVVEFTDRRFVAWRARSAAGFTFRVTLDSTGRVLDRGWVGDVSRRQRGTRGSNER